MEDCCHSVFGTDEITVRISHIVLPSTQFQRDMEKLESSVDCHYDQGFRAHML